MPPPKKIDLVPAELRERLRLTLEERGFGDIIEVTEELNAWLAAEGMDLTLGKSAVGDYSKLLKDQREAYALADTLLGDMDLEQESDLHKVLLQMIATSAVHMMQSVRSEGENLQPDDLMKLGRMLKDLMHSTGIREKLRADERERVAAEARAALEAEQSEALDGAVAKGVIDADAAQAAREVMGFG